MIIDFYHQRDENNHPFATACVIKMLDGTTFHGRSLCHPNDNFNKAEGRKRALTRAISSLPRETRKTIWAQYRQRFLRRTDEFTT